VRSFEWVGKWFAPIKYARYRVPEDAVNYVDLRGQEGQCIESKQTGFGHCWALINFDEAGLKWVRTCYLVPVNEGDDSQLVDEVGSSMTPAQHAEYALKQAGNHGTIINFDQRDE
jgi:hypothetical protein